MSYVLALFHPYKCIDIGAGIFTDSGIDTDIEVDKDFHIDKYSGAQKAQVFSFGSLSNDQQGVLSCLIAKNVSIFTMFFMDKFIVRKVLLWVKFRFSLGQ